MKQPQQTAQNIKAISLWNLKSPSVQAIRDSQKDIMKSNFRN